MGKGDIQTVHAKSNAQLYSAGKLSLILSSVGTGRQTLTYCWQEFKLVRAFCVRRFLDIYQNKTKKIAHTL